MKKYVADFCTISNIDECRVWCYGLCSIDNTSDFSYGYTIDELMEFCEKKINTLLYFHNLKFDGEFIIEWLNKNNYKQSINSKIVKTKSFTVIKDKEILKSINIYFYIDGKYQSKVKILDSLTLLPYSINKIAKNYGLKNNEVKLDYNKQRPIGYKITLNEIEYIKNNVTIMAKALKIFYEKYIN